MEMAASFGMPTLLPVLLTGSTQGLEKLMLVAKFPCRLKYKAAIHEDRFADQKTKDLPFCPHSTTLQFIRIFPGSSLRQNATRCEHVVR
jgi:hypothetical protein